jgi:hypothetical protein
LIAHVTALEDALVTVAVNCCCPPAVSVALVGLMETPTLAGGETVIFAVPKMLESASLVAVTVMFWVDVTLKGAVYTPLAVIVPT